MKPIKTSTLVLSAALALPLGAGAFLSGCASTATSESTGQYIDNSALTAKVKSALIGDEMVKGRDVEVESYKGTVQLSGFVDSQKQKDRAEAIAKSIAGVEKVENKLTVK